MMMRNALVGDMTLDQITSTINGLIQQGNTGAHQIGVLYNHVVEKRLAIIAGYKDTRDYFNQHVKALSQASLSLYGRVAQAFPEDYCTRYGPYKLRALLVYLDASGITLAEGDPAVIRIDVPGENDEVVRKPFAECSLDELERATRAKKAPPKVPVPIVDRARLLFIAESLNRNFTGVAPVRMSSRSHEGQTLINLQDVPMTQLTRLMQALQEGMDAQPTLAAR